MSDELPTQIESADDPAKTLGVRETWTGNDVYVLRDDQGRFATWREVRPAEIDAEAQTAAADGGDQLSFETDTGADVTVTADGGRLRVDYDNDDKGIHFDGVVGELDRVHGTDVLDCGYQRDDSGERFEALVVVDGRRRELEDLRDAPAPDEETEYSDEVQAAIEEAVETGEEVTIDTQTTDCNDPGKECSLDKVTRVATPDGDLDARRTHTY